MISEKILTSTLRVINQHLLHFDRSENITLPGPSQGHNYVLYLHIPFCETLCPYCSFNRFLFVEQQARTYFKALRKEMQIVARSGYRFDSIYIGGGTPTILNDELCKTIDLAHELFGARIVSCETNPDHLTINRIEQLGGRVHRMSVGIQSFNNDLLRKINRLERFGPGDEMLERIQSVAGMFPSLNIDLIFNFPGQSEQDLLEDIEKVIVSGANQVTFYPLMVSPSVKESIRSSFGEVDYKQEADFYEFITENLGREFNQSTVWTFSRKGADLIDEYIADCEEFVGLGSGAFSYLNGILYINTFSLKTYEESLRAGRLPVSGKRIYLKHEMMCYQMMMNLFGLQLDKRQFKQRFGTPVEYGIPIELAFLTMCGALNFDNPERICLTSKGRYLEVVMMREFFAGINQFRDQERQAIGILANPVINQTCEKERTTSPMV
jgi:menaquinone C8-methyltransferase